jgi:hypothetical protein
MCKWEMLVIEYTHSEAGPYNIPRAVSINQRLYLLTKSCVSWLIINTPEIEVKETDFSFHHFRIRNSESLSILSYILHHRAFRLWAYMFCSCNKTSLLSISFKF